MRSERPSGGAMRETAITLAATGAILYLCFTPHGHRSLRQLERWLDEGESETARLLESAGRLAALAGTVSAALGGCERRVVDVAEFPTPVRRTSP